MYKKQRGLTFIQVVAAIIILGIIASIASVSMFHYMNKAELAKGHLQADLIQEAVASYMIENEGKLPLVKENDDYIEKPALIDISKISDDINNEVVGNFYIYGPSKTVYFDYPTDYIAKVYNEYENKSAIIDKYGYINTEKLHKEGLLEYSAITSYILVSGEVVQVIDDKSKSKNQTGDNQPTKPIIIPSQSAPFYNDDKITFTAKSYSSKGEVRYEWKGIQSDNQYPIGELTISVIAYDIDGNASEKTTETYQIKSVNSANNAPSKPTITKTPNKTTYSSDETIKLSANATDPDGDSLDYIWIGKENDNTYRRGTHEISVYAVDEHGATSQKTTTTLHITNGPPTILSVEQIPDPAYLFDTVDIKIDSEDPDGDLVSYDIQGLNDTRRYSYTHENNGEHEITVTAIDSLGAKSEPKKFIIKITNRPPTKPFIIMTPTDEDPTKLRPDTLVKWKTGGSKDPDNHRFTYEWLNKEDKYPIGRHTVKVRAVDEFGAKSEWNSITFQVVNTAPKEPIITMYPPSTSDLRSYTDFSFSAMTTDAEKDDFTYIWSNRKSTYPIGVHTVKVRAKDEYGYSSTWGSVTFRVNNTPPTKPTYLHMNPISNLYADTNISWDTGGSTDIDGDNITYEWVNKQSKYRKGTHTVKVRAKDSRGDYSPYISHTFTVKNTRPTTPSIGTNSHIRYYNENSIISFEIKSPSTDLDNDNITYEWKIDSGSWTTVVPRKRFSDRSHTVYARARDEDNALSNFTSYRFNWRDPWTTQRKVRDAYTYRVKVRDAYRYERKIRDSYYRTETYTDYIPWCEGTSPTGTKVYRHAPPCQYSKNQTTKSVTRTRQVYVPAEYETVYVPADYDYIYVPADYETVYHSGYWYKY